MTGYNVGSEFVSDQNLHSGMCRYRKLRPPKEEIRGAGMCSQCYTVVCDISVFKIQINEAKTHT